MDTLRRRLHSCKVWLQEINHYDKMNKLSVSQQRLITRIYIIVFTVAIIGLFIYISLSDLQYTVTIQSPSSEDFFKLKSLQNETLSCPCSNITISYERFITLEPVFHSVCSSYYVTKEWSNALFFKNASNYLLTDIRSTLSAQFQLLSSLCLIAQQTGNDAVSQFKANQFISTEPVFNSSFQDQTNARVTEMQSNAASSLLRALSVIRQTVFTNQFISAVGSNSASALFIYDSEYTIGITACRYNATNGDTCYCQESYECHAPVGIFNETMPTDMYAGCYSDISIDKSLIIFDGLFAGCIPLESLLTSSLTCFYDEECLQSLQEYIGINTNISTLILSENSQFNKNSTIMEMIQKLLVQQWKVNISYEDFFTACAPMMCSYTYTQSANFIYIIVKLLGFYGGLNIALISLILLLIKYYERRNKGSDQLDQSLSKIEKIRITIKKLKTTIIEINIFDHKDKLTIRQQRIATRLFFILFSSAILILTLFSMLTMQTYKEIVNSPIQQDFERLQMLYPNTLSCPCSQVNIPQKEFVKFSPNFHIICSSIFITDPWFHALSDMHSGKGNVVCAQDLSYVGLSNFLQLQSFCSLANQTVTDALINFDNAAFVSQYVLPVNTLNIEINVTIHTFERSTEDTFSLEIKVIQYSSYGNQLISALFINDYLVVVNSSTDNLTVEIGSQVYSISNTSTCSCILQPSSCVTLSGIYGSISANTSDFPLLLLVPSMVQGCFSMDSLFLSTLECFYNQSCLDQLQPYITDFNFTNAALIQSNSSRYEPNTLVGEIVEQLLLEDWNASVSYENYFASCAPQYCTYSHENRRNMLYLLTTLLSLVSGLSVAFRILSPFLTSILFKERRYNNIRNKLNNLLSYTRSIPSLIKKGIITLNLYKKRNQQENEARIHLQRQATRLYLFILIFTLVILAVYQTLSVSTFTENIKNPSSIIFSNFYKRYGDAFVCPCKVISMQYSQLVQIEFRFHSICSSDFITAQWFNNLYRIPTTFAYSDFRTTALAHFQLLSYLCKLANDTLTSAQTSFLSNNFVSTRVISYENFLKQIQVAIGLFQSNVRSIFVQLFQLIRSTTNANAWITVYTTSWKYTLGEIINYGALFPRPMTYDHENGSCSCGTDDDCSQPAGIYNGTNTILIPGIRVGCYPLNNVFQSTLQCLYDQECVDLLRSIFNISTSFTAIDNTIESQFYSNTTLESIVDELFIESRYTNISYEKYFQICGASMCSYTYSERANLIYVLTTLIALFGGLRVSLRLLSPVLIRILKIIIEHIMKCRANRVAHITS